MIALLHDIDDHKFSEDHGRVEGFLEQLELEESVKESIALQIKHIGFKSEFELSLEG